MFTPCFKRGVLAFSTFEHTGPGLDEVAVREYERRAVRLRRPRWVRGAVAAVLVHKQGCTQYRFLCTAQLLLARSFTVRGAPKSRNALEHDGEKESSMHKHSSSCAITKQCSKHVQLRSFRQPASCRRHETPASKQETAAVRRTHCKTGCPGCGAPTYGVGPKRCSILSNPPMCQLGPLGQGFCIRSCTPARTHGNPKR